MPYQPPSVRQLPWLQAGYAAFAQHGPVGLKVEVLARAVGRSKSSFYHHFADLVIFTDRLLDLHLDRVRALAERERQCRQLDPDLLDLLLAHQPDLLFHRQLRIAGGAEPFATCLTRADADVSAAFRHIWAEVVGLSGQSYAARQLYELAVADFYLRLTAAPFGRPWLVAYFAGIRLLVADLQRQTKNELDGAV